MDRVLALSLHDIEARRTFLEVFHMLKPPATLFGLGIAAKVLRGAGQRVTGEKQTTGRELPEAALSPAREEQPRRKRRWKNEKASHAGTQR